MGQVVHIHGSQVPRLGGAVEAFFADRDFAAETRRTYGRALDALVSDLGGDLSLEFLSSEGIRRVFKRRWGEASAATWNTRLTAVASFGLYCRRSGWIEVDLLAGIERRRLRRARTPVVPFRDLEALFGRRDVGLRERTLWRMLYETAARASEVLALNVEDLDIVRRRATVVCKGGDRDPISWATPTARLLPGYLSGRRRGPVFLTDRRPRIAPTRENLCPVTGRGRLSYRRAAAVFKQASGGWTLHQLRHSSLAHLAEGGASPVMLQAKSRYRDLRALSAYTRPGPEPVAGSMAEQFDQAGPGTPIGR